jgi:hypothetical protein
VFLSDVPQVSVGPPPYITDRPTKFHDGKELYINLRRIAVLKRFRGDKVVRMLADAKLCWARESLAFFNLSIAGMEIHNLGAKTREEIPA